MTKVRMGDYNKIVDMFHSETDRGAAVLAGSFLESFMSTFLKSKMINDPMVDGLFTGFGPLSDFKKRIESAYAFKFISKDQRNDLEIIRKVRNHFAHHPFDASFGVSPVFDLCNNLTTQKLYPLDGEAPDKNKNSRHRYLLAISILMIGLGNQVDG